MPALYIATACRLQVSSSHRGRHGRSWLIQSQQNRGHDLQPTSGAETFTHRRLTLASFSIR
ncbi:hypothetical protein E2C01_094173 [Portunus trituberculatus]|uniref:Uncharacterized protein n=1 Tax=Portunus trituberculatus TaxID=210409 RepID=A0A5B7JL63_PORTR|nr:hypothetical protein [Portunus trituberculatus]